MAEIKINPIQLVTVGNYNAVINTIVTDSYDFLGGVVIEKNGQERSTWWGDSGIAILLVATKQRFVKVVR